MKDTGIHRYVDSLGRIVIPVELRKTLNIEPGDSMEVFVEDDGSIVLMKYQPGCIFCGEMDDLVVHEGMQVCHDCIGEMQDV